MTSSEGEAPIWSLVLGTAGHIDHGKSSLVQRLTGVNPDRLPEEKQRNLTIDLGFAPWRLQDGRTVGIVDVPGHERFIKNMVAGASGIDVVVLVIAADDGIMPQTREHFEILRFLGIDRGVVALTKIDIVDPELVEVVQLEIADFLAGTALESAPIVPCSSVTGEGFEELRETLIGALDQARQRSCEGAFRMPIQRVFSAKGFGGILTGIPISGQVKVGDTVEVQPGGAKGKIRGIQAYKRKVSEAQAGHSTALNVPDLDWKLIHRGAVVASPGVYESHRYIELQFHALSELPWPIKNRTIIRLHTGTCEALGELVILDRPVLNAGETALCQVRLEEAICMVPGDRFIARLQSPLILLGGGEIIGASKFRLKAGKPRVIERLGKKAGSLDSLAEQIALVVADHGATPLRAEEIAKLVSQPLASIESELEQLCVGNRLARFSGKGGTAQFVDAEVMQKRTDQLIECLAAFHKSHPKRLGLTRQQLTNDVGVHPLIVEAIVQRDDSIAHEDSGLLRLASHEVTLSADEQAFARALEERFKKAGYATPDRAEAIASLAAELRAPIQGHEDDLVTWLFETGKLIQLRDEVIFHRSCYERAKERARRFIEESDGLKTSDFRSALETSRKYIIPLLEHFDEIGFTVRVGDLRRLRKKR